jgi:transposase-like protein
MSQTRRKFTREFKVAVVKRLQAGYPVGRVARELEVNASQLQLWKRELQERPNSAFSGEGRKRAEETQVAELERRLASRPWKSIF